MVEHTMYTPSLIQTQGSYRVFTALVTFIFDNDTYSHSHKPFILHLNKIVIFQKGFNAGQILVQLYIFRFDKIFKEGVLIDLQLQTVYMVTFLRPFINAYPFLRI